MKAVRVGRGSEVGLTTWRSTDTALFVEMLVSAFISLYAAFIISWDAVILAGNPDTVLTCDINAAVSCGTVAQSWQAALLGFPNSFIGLISEPVIITIAVAALSGVKFKRWFMFTANVVYLAGLVFALWLFYQSAFVIGALCPYCLLITLGTTMVFFTMLHYNIRENNLYLNAKWQARLESMARMGLDFALAIIILASVSGIILFKYGTILFA